MSVKEANFVVFLLYLHRSIKAARQHGKTSTSIAFFHTLMFKYRTAALEILFQATGSQILNFAFALWILVDLFQNWRGRYTVRAIFRNEKTVLTLLIRKNVTGQSSRRWCIRVKGRRIVCFHSIIINMTNFIPAYQGMVKIWQQVKLILFLMRVK